MPRGDKTLNKVNVESGIKPKHVGRKKGVPNNVTATMRDMARPYAKTAIRVIKNLLASENEAIRLAAGKEILDRSHGKSINMQETTVDIKAEIVVTDTDLARRAAFILAREEKRILSAPVLTIDQPESVETPISEAAQGS
jgi:hypothetical protein